MTNEQIEEVILTAYAIGTPDGFVNIDNLKKALGKDGDGWMGKGEEGMKEALKRIMGKE